MSVVASCFLSYLSVVNGSFTVGVEVEGRQLGDLRARQRELLTLGGAHADGAVLKRDKLADDRLSSVACMKELRLYPLTEAGEDVLCAALSAMTMLIVNTIEVGYASDVEYDVNEGATVISVKSRAALPEYEDDERKRYAVSGLFCSYFYQLNELVEEYYEYLQVDVVDKEYE